MKLSFLDYYTLPFEKKKNVKSPLPLCIHSTIKNCILLFIRQIERVILIGWGDNVNGGVKFGIFEF